MPGRFGLRYVGRDGELHQPAMLHRAVLGSLERFIGIYIEHTGGDFPVLALAGPGRPAPDLRSPRAGRARRSATRSSAAGLRAEVDDRSETLGFRIREAETQKIPLTLVIGDEEVAGGTVAPRLRKSKQAMDAMAADELVSIGCRIGERRATLGCHSPDSARNEGGTSIPATIQVPHRGPGDATRFA